MQKLIRLLILCALTASVFTISSCADRTERFLARQELQIARIERQQDRYAAEEQRRQEQRERQ